MSITISEEIRKNFHLFWDNYPAPVMLVHKDRTIIDVNTAALEIGLPVGMRCVDFGQKKDHAACKANKALQEGKGMRTVTEYLGQVVDGYWVPLAGSGDLFVHFNNDITPYAAEHLIPKKCGGAESGSCSGE